MQDAFDLFAHFFGDRGRGGFQRGAQKGPDAVTNLAVSLKDMYNGGNVEFTINLQSVCDECDGTGSDDGKEHVCEVCSGSGMRTIRHQLAPGMIQHIQTTCDRCGGKGRIITTPCKTCGGSKVVREDREYNIYVDAGTDRSTEYRIAGEADQSPDWEAGDLRVRIVESSHDNFGYRRRGTSLFRTEVLSEIEAVGGGWTRSIPFLDGKSNLTLTRAEGKSVSHGEVEVLKGKGMPHPDDHSKHGNLYIDYVVILAGGQKGKAHAKRDL
jgi:DnaJ-related protein SCJ1